MTTATRKTYFNLAMQQPVEWLRDCAKEPSPYMRPRHVALVKLAIRAKAKRAA